MCKWRIIFKWILNKQNVNMWTGFTWHQIRSNGRPVWRHYWTFWFHKSWSKSLEYLNNFWLIKYSSPRRWLPVYKIIILTTSETPAIEVNAFKAFLFIEHYLNIHFSNGIYFEWSVFTYFSIYCTRTKYIVSVMYYSLLVLCLVCGNYRKQFNIRLF
jgi:hypothetical protein